MYFLERQIYLKIVAFGDKYLKIVTFGDKLQFVRRASNEYHVFNHFSRFFTHYFLFLSGFRWNSYHFEEFSDFFVIRKFAVEGPQLASIGSKNAIGDCY